MRVYKRRVLTAGVCITVLCLYKFGSFYGKDEHLPDQQSTFGANRIASYFVENSTIVYLNDRIQHLQKECQRSHDKNKHKLPYRRTKPMWFHSKRLNISVCKVPKAGSTFWGTLFLIFRKGMSVSKAFHTPRSKIHTLTYRFTTSSNTDQGALSEKGVVVSRDPYSRLFSAFMDKFFLFLFPSLAKYLGMRTGNVPYMTEAGAYGYNFTFNDFLNMVTKQFLHVGYCNPHWCPIYILCRVCDVEYHYVVKQETLTRDTEHIVNQMDISDDTKLSLSQMFHGPATDETVIGLIDDMWNSSSNCNRQTFCKNTLAKFIKMWEAFKILGYIRTNVTFPLSAFKETNRLNLQGITEAVLTAMNTNPLSSTERKAQRKHALVEAYKGIPKRLIAKIQEIYKMDFQLFGYDINPP